MTRLRALGSRHWLAALIMVLAALAVRAAVPVGYMPQSTDKGTLITLCTGQGAVKVMMPAAQGGAKHESEKGNGDMPCAFAAGVHAIDLPVVAMLAVPTLLPIPLPAGRAIAHLTVHRLAAPPPPSQAPPAAH